MKVRELIKALEELNDPEADVVVRGYEDGCNDVSSIGRVLLKRDQNTEWYYGAHEYVSPMRATEESGVTPAFEIMGGTE